MSEGNTAMSYDVLLKRAEALLVEWGECWHQGGRPAFPQGYPRETTESRLMRDFGRRTKRDRRRRRFHRRERRLVVVGGTGEGRELTCPKCQRPTGADPCEHCGCKVRRLVPELRMYPDRADRQSKGPGAPEAAWPDHIQELDRLLAELPRRLVSVARTYYVAGMTIRVGAETLRVSKDEYKRRLDAIRWYVVGGLKRVDTGLSRQKDAP